MGTCLTSTAVVFNDGSTQTTAGAPAGNVQTFSSSGTWTKPTGATFVQVQIWGAGGGGGSGGAFRDAQYAGYNAAVYRQGGGGGGGSFNTNTYLASSLTSTVCVAIGAGGSGGTGQAATAVGYPGSKGGNSCFGAYLYAFGGDVACCQCDGGNGASAWGNCGYDSSYCNQSSNPGVPGNFYCCGPGSLVIYSPFLDKIGGSSLVNQDAQCANVITKASVCGGGAGGSTTSPSSNCQLKISGGKSHCGGGGGGAGSNCGCPAGQGGGSCLGILAWACACCWMSGTGGGANAVNGSISACPAPAVYGCPGAAGGFRCGASGGTGLSVCSFGDINVFGGNGGTGGCGGGGGGGGGAVQISDACYIGPCSGSGGTGGAGYAIIYSW